MCWFDYGGLGDMFGLFICVLLFLCFLVDLSLVNSRYLLIIMNLVTIRL